MSLRYKGIPQRGSNRIVDSFPELCLCKFTIVGFPLDNNKCTIHHQLFYACDRCTCVDYCPQEEKKYPNHWPLCTCGHIAQEHN